VTVLSSPGRALGLFAQSDIPAGSIVLYQPPLLLVLDAIASVDIPPPALRASQSPRMEKLDGLCGYRREEWESTERGILWSNGFGVLSGATTRVFDRISRANHSCLPNSRFVWCDAPAGGSGGREEEGEVGRMMLFSTFDLMVGEEITVDYGHGVQGLRKWYGFECVCGGCDG
ncbi:hypothetical protein BJ875DRAFT_353011, partial [Amylocarpus encephaloides]